MTYDRILLASDGTDASAAALDDAIAFAEAFDAALHVIYVLDVAEQPPDVEDPGEHPELKAKRERALEEPARRAEQAGVEVTAAAVRGDSADIAGAILAFVREHDVDLIVMGTHGRTGLDRLLVGSVAEDVIRNAPVPVVTARPDVAATDGA